MKKKMLISIAIISILLLNCIAPILKVAAGTDIRVMFEKNMYAAIKDELQRQGITAIYNDAQRTMIINDEELAKVTSFSLSNSELTDLTGLEVFTNLKELDLSSNELDKTSNLEVLNSFTLTTLDLSSNEIEDLSMVTNIKNISKLNLHNQKFDVVEVIQIDTTETSDQYNEVLYPLPKILTDLVDYIPSEWLVEKNYFDNGHEDLGNPKATPHVDWSKFDQENVKIRYAYKTATTYELLKGMVKVSIKVVDSTSTLYNSDINLYFVTADSEERGIHIKDTNMYNAIKRQLTKGQTENDQLISYGNADTARTLYNRSFDDAQTLVIGIDDLINKISNLKLDNKRIKDLSGIEKFVGLETNLDLSGNYIKSIDPLIELEENQEKEEALLKERVQAQIGLVSETVGKIESLKSQIEALQKEIADIEAKFNTDLQKLQDELKALREKEAQIKAQVGADSAKIGELQKQIEDLNKEQTEELNKQKEATERINALREQLKELEAADQPIKDEIERLKAQIQELENTIRNSQERVNSLTIEVSTKQEQISTAKTAIAIYETEVAELRENIIAAQEILESITDTATGVANPVDVENYIQGVNEEIRKLQDRIDELYSDISTSTDEQSRLQAEIETLKGRIEKAEDDKAEAQENLAAREEDLKNSTNAQQAEDVRKQIEEEQGKIDASNANIEVIKKSIELAQKQLEEEEAKSKKVQDELADVEKQIEAKLAEIQKLVDDRNNQEKALGEKRAKLAELQMDLAREEARLMERMQRLYNIYNRIDRLAGFATSKVRTITDKEFKDATFEEAKSMYSAQVSKISNIEKYLTGFERNYLLTTYNIPTTLTFETEHRTVNPETGEVTVTTETETKPIENPITKYFTELPQDSWTVLDYKLAIRNFQRDDIYMQMYTHCYFTRLFEGTTNCVATEYADYMIKRLEIDGEDTTLYREAIENYADIYKTFGGDDNCAGKATTDKLFSYAKRITLAPGDEIEAYVYLPRLKVLDISENLIENIDNISKLTKLVKLYAGDNELVDISKVDWTSMNEHLKVLDLSLNDISNIEPLEVLTNIEYLDLSKNLIEGEFTFKVEKLENLKNLDLSYNRIDDIQRLINYLTYEARAHGYDGDIGSYLRTGNLTVNFKYQQLEMTVDGVLPVGDTYKVELPKIFRQIEQIDYANTSFGIDSIRGNVTSDGKDVIVDTRVAGKHTGIVTIINTKTVASLGYGTTCTITYKVGTANMLEVKVTPENANVEKGKTQEFKAEVTGDNVPHKGVTWSIAGNTSENTKISEAGLLTVAEDETSEKIEVIATSFYDTTAIGKVEVVITEKAGEPVNPDDNKEPEIPTHPDDNKEPETPTDPDDNKEPETPTNPDDNKEPETPANPDDKKDETTTIEFGYDVDIDNDYLVGIKAQTSVDRFKSVLLNDNDDYIVVVKSANREVKTGNIATGMFAQVQDKNGNVVKDTNGNLLVYEIIVKGDVNGDGVADSLDTVSIKAHRSEVKLLKGAALKAADINNDNSVDSTDSKLLLYHRAEVSGYNLNYTK